eukprot:39421-Chlamydomonas_euryale.AAC.3
MPVATPCAPASGAAAAPRRAPHAACARPAGAAALIVCMQAVVGPAVAPRGVGAGGPCARGPRDCLAGGGDCGRGGGAAASRGVLQSARASRSASTSSSSTHAVTAPPPPPASARRQLRAAPRALPIARSAGDDEAYPAVDDDSGAGWGGARTARAETESPAGNTSLADRFEVASQYMGDNSYSMNNKFNTEPDFNDPEWYKKVTVRLCGKRRGWTRAAGPWEGQIVLGSGFRRQGLGGSLRHLHAATDNPMRP